jgi:DNA mismatch repair ATPase MutS
MQIDKTTYEDLSVFSHGEDSSIFEKLDYTRTVGGKSWLMEFFKHPFSDSKRIGDTQQILILMLDRLSQWPMTITNGTIMVMERFYETALDEMPEQANFLNGITYKVLHGPDYSVTRYSVSHFGDFTRGLLKIIELFDQDHCPFLLRAYLDRAKTLLGHDTIQALNRQKPADELSPKQTIYYGHFLRNKFKQAALELIDIYGRLDAWYSMALATQNLHLTLPIFVDQDKPLVHASSLFHILLDDPTAYHVQLDQRTNFLFLTGANMAGKSTFIKAVGAAVYLAHLGMGVPAQQMRLSLFDGILSNINVTDNLAKGESYFFNEVQRIKNTIIKISDGHKWLVLIDELFKGTNVEDAMKCSSTVVKGLIKIKTSLFILSTHLYEIGEELKQYPNIAFRYFETLVKGDQLDFSYQLKEGISNDRLGYLILKKENVVDMLEKL